jgi:hypothetical protein
MKKLILLVLLTVPFWSAAQTDYSHLEINNVSWWWSESGSIDSLLIEVKPKGIYNEISLTFDFSARGTSFSPYDSLEVEMQFKLPEDAEMIDMWLWIGDTIIVADVYDKWTATQIYEDIVDRRTDPAILYKFSGYDSWTGQYLDEYYMFRIFPMLTTLPRKAKFTYLVRAQDYMSRNPMIDLPVSIMRLSAYDILSTRLRLYPQSGMTSPKVEQYPSTVFSYVPSAPAGPYYEADITSVPTTSAITCSYRHSMVSPAWSVWADSNNNENLFQMQIIPDELFGFRAKKKAVILFDYIDANCSYYTGTTLLDEIEKQISHNLEGIDSVCFMFSGVVTQMYGSGWIAADSVNIANAFNTFNASWFNSYSNLSTVLVDGINFIRNHNNEGAIVLISSDNSHGNPVNTNAFISNLLTLMDTVDIPIHILDLNSYSTPSFYFGQQYFYGNDYLYMILSAQTTGEQHSIRDEQPENMFSSIFSKLCGYFGNFSIYIFPQGGYTYSNYTLKTSGGLYYYDQPVQILGKYNGSMPFHLMVFAEKDGVMLMHDADITIGTNYSSDSVTRQMWVAQYLRELAGYSQTNSVVSQMIGTSMEERVLCDYTAFLALEPGEGPLADEPGSGRSFPGISEPGQFTGKHSVHNC